ncbi:uncharacterized protein [Macaca nemestrina]|uniref:uncharacterized protein isoform X4 n=1 Tax=Macaca nemestrina TaxID=9545 RepID=UPI0039B84E29
MWTLMVSHHQRKMKNLQSVFVLMPHFRAKVLHPDHALYHPKSVAAVPVAVFIPKMEGENGLTPGLSDCSQAKDEGTSICSLGPSTSAKKTLLEEVQELETKFPVLGKAVVWKSSGKR